MVPYLGPETFSFLQTRSMSVENQLQALVLEPQAPRLVRQRGSQTPSLATQAAPFQFSYNDSGTTPSMGPSGPRRVAKVTRPKTDR